MFFDPQTGFSIVTDEVKPLPSPMGELTRRWLNAGGLVKVQRRKDPEKQVLETPPVDSLDQKAKQYLENYDRIELMHLAKEKGLEVRRSDTALDLAKRLVVFELGNG